MYSEVQDRGDRISTTALTGKCDRQLYLTRMEDYSEDPEKLWAPFRGTMIHSHLEAHAAPGTIEEPRYHVHLDGLGDLSGSPDVLDVRMGVLYDYKRTKEVPRFNYPWKDHVNQMNVNRWLVDHADYVEYRGKQWDLRLSRENRARFRPTVWNDLVVVYIDDKGPKPLSCTKSVQVPKKDGKGTKAARVLDLWSDEEAEAWIRQRWTEVKSALAGESLPPVPDYMAGWEHPLCGFCPKKRECIELHYEAHYTSVPFPTLKDEVSA